ncbi:MAG: hypothetical protein SPJ14_08430, partial [Succinivibrio sp.]|nr:hypothetical protein [Succinivibrio sp.]
KKKRFCHQEITKPIQNLKALYIMTHSLTRKMSDTFSENDKGFENTTETSHARYQHQRINH